MRVELSGWGQAGTALGYAWDARGVPRDLGMLRLEKRSPGSHTVTVQDLMPYLGVNNPTWAATSSYGGAQTHVSIYNPTQASTTTPGLAQPHKSAQSCVHPFNPTRACTALMGVAQLHTSTGTTLHRDTDPP